MALDRFQSFSQGANAPASDAFPITPNDTADLTQVTRALYVGGAGDVTLVTAEGSTVTFVALLAGTVLPVRASRLVATGTTATNLLGLV